jgi:predicted Rossmann fold flavoprotein
LNKNSSSENCNVIILGGGAAGLMCALTAAQRGRCVIVLEKANKIGKKILMSGGGRCNFTNYSVEPENFVSTNPHFCKSALSRYTQWDFIKLVEKHGISFEERKHQQLFCKDSASHILAMLENECILAGVTIHTHCKINNINPLTADDSANKLYQLNYSRSGKTPIQQATLLCDSLVVATGGLSVPTLGGSSMGYDIATQFDLKLTERRAGLVPFMFTDEFKAFCEKLSGVSTDIEMYCNGRRFRENLLFTHRGISGPAILQISSYWLPGNTITINLLPDMNARAWLCDAKQSKSKSLLKTVVQQKLPRALTDALQELWWPELTQKPLAEISDQVLNTIGEKLNAWDLKPSATEGYRTAEVTLGGVDTDGISSKTFEAKHTPGLYFIGEVLDVSGHLGGFNFQWAWSSGYVAGRYV